MKPDRVFVARQVNRLSGLDYFPKEPIAVNELIDALMRADSDVIVTAVVNEWLEESSERPTPADLHEAVRRHNRMVRPESRPDANCDICGGTGWRVVHRGGISGADRCACWPVAQRAAAAGVGL